MFDRKEAKKASKQRLKRHYWIFVVACFFASLWGIHSIVNINAVKIIMHDKAHLIPDGDIAAISDEIWEDEDDAVSVFAKVATGCIEEGRVMADKISQHKKDHPDRYFNGLEMGHKAGVLAKAANAVSSGNIFVMIFMSIHSIVGSDSTATIVFIVLSLLVLLALWAVILNTYNAVYRRIFLEGYIYSKVPIRTFIHFIHIKKYLKATVAMLVVSALKIAWAITIAGAVIKHFSYILVPYIIAENPDISPVKAIRLSEKMMQGHKMECFKLKCSFIGWYILDILSLGLVGIFFYNSYAEGFFTEYYVYLRKLAKEKNIENSELLNDTYLYEKADREKLENVYSDIVEIKKSYNEKVYVSNPVWRFFANVFGIVPAHNKTEQKYFDNNIKAEKIKAYEKIIDGQAYPCRLNPVPEKQKKNRLEFLNYRRHYSLGSLVTIYMSVNVVGWIWETCFHLIESGEFVKRGLLQGPWIPIYGTGGLVMLIFLNKFRKRPVVHFISSIVLCGFLEYFTAFLLEILFGEKWWDYTGYFLNIHGRICAEGLIFFGVGGMAIVYFVAPIVDNFYMKAKKKIFIPVFSIVLLIFMCDYAYSMTNPNKGEGVTEYDEVYENKTETVIKSI